VPLLAAWSLGARPCLEAIRSITDPAATTSSQQYPSDLSFQRIFLFLCDSVLHYILSSKNCISRYLCYTITMATVSTTLAEGGRRSSSSSRRATHGRGGAGKISLLCCPNDDTDVNGRQHGSRYNRCQPRRPRDSYHQERCLYDWPRREWKYGQEHRSLRSSEGTRCFRVSVMSPSNSSVVSHIPQAVGLPLSATILTFKVLRTVSPTLRHTSAEAVQQMFSGLARKTSRLPNAITRYGRARLGTSRQGQR
jgi:hypothetical protein